MAKKHLPAVPAKRPTVGSTQNLATAPTTTAEFAAENPAQFDNRSVANFAYAMRVKLAVKRLDGRGGWQDKEQCSNEYLSNLLREHVEKGDPVDVANFCMMLHQRGERIVPAPPAHQVAGEIERLRANRNLFAGKYRSIIVLMDDTRQMVQEIVDHIQDDGDRAYFGSTNHADRLRDLVEDMDGWSFDAMLPKGDINKMERDPYAAIREQRSRADNAETALKLAISHIEHMAAFITKQDAGYSFESLGEDMPGIKEALAASEGQP